MEDLQFEQKLDGLSEKTVSEFMASFTEPIQISIDDKIKFEILFDFQKAVLFKNADVY